MTFSLDAVRLRSPAAAAGDLPHLLALRHPDRRFFLPARCRRSSWPISASPVSSAPSDASAGLIRRHDRDPVRRTCSSSTGWRCSSKCSSWRPRSWSSWRRSIIHRFTFFRGEYYFLVVMSALGMMFMASANDLLSVFITLEFSTFGFYVLVAYLREDMASNEAGLKFFILGVFAAGLLAYGISLGLWGNRQNGLLGHEIASSRHRDWSSASCSFSRRWDSRSAPCHFIHGFPTPITARRRR